MCVPGPLQPAGQRGHHVWLVGQGRVGHRGDAAEHAVAGEEARAPQRYLAPEHEHHLALMCPPEPFGLVCAAGQVPGQRAGFKVDRDGREPQLQPGGKCVLAGLRYPLRVIAGHPYRARVQVAGNDLQLPLHHRVVEVLAGVVPVGGESGVVVDPVVPHDGHPSVNAY